ncbi:unnamed protein product [Microthlaspi erraticum]|uniref:Uncharacterized protein n=1 Tax=Microthlaspi erraticum TaxID=1685480 RepID=A0A6D2JY44_9BRAS|nr:unnamed protein product [Microthlaspi erraticum]
MALQPDFSLSDPIKTSPLQPTRETLDSFYERSSVKEGSFPNLMCTQELSPISEASSSEMINKTFAMTKSEAEMNA